MLSTHNIRLSTPSVCMCLMVWMRFRKLWICASSIGSCVLCQLACSPRTTVASPQNRFVYASISSEIAGNSREGAESGKSGSVMPIFSSQFRAAFPTTGLPAPPLSG